VATQNVSEGQLTALIAVVPSAVAADHSVWPPVGLPDTTICPDTPTATHNPAVGHEMPFSA
jgi:hypothetical protein